jgi:hypothetical protein
MLKTKACTNPQKTTSFLGSTLLDAYNLSEASEFRVTLAQRKGEQRAFLLNCDEPPNDYYAEFFGLVLRGPKKIRHNGMEPQRRWVLSDPATGAFSIAHMHTEICCLPTSESSFALTNDRRRPVRVFA